MKKASSRIAKISKPDQTKPFSSTSSCITSPLREISMQFWCNPAAFIWDASRTWCKRSTHLHQWVTNPRRFVLFVKTEHLPDLMMHRSKDGRPSTRKQTMSGVEEISFVSSITITRAYVTCWWYAFLFFPIFHCSIGVTAISFRNPFFQFIWMRSSLFIFIQVEKYFYKFIVFFFRWSLSKTMNVR